ncbi:hypothetical protein BBJ28_00014229, partial [Nothophytophthora sp. Chile5]
FQLDPTDPKFRKSEATQAIFKERRQRYDTAAGSSAVSQSKESEAASASEGRKKNELKAMVESLKRKSVQQDKKKAKKAKKHKA